jgi:SAM-dependent methyltransferase
MPGYYAEKLSADRLRLCYEIASPHIKRYLTAELDFVLDKLKPAGVVLELGCGYGRVLQRLIGNEQIVIGIDTSFNSLRLANEMGGETSCHLFQMNAVQLGFRDSQFDLVICVQNGILAFKVNQRDLIKETLRVTRVGGTVLFSSYSDRYWEDRIEWFQAQADHGLIGEIDADVTGGGVIVCKDGFSFTTVSVDNFISLTSDLGVHPRIAEVDDSCIFCEIQVPKEPATSA